MKIKRNLRHRPHKAHIHFSHISAPAEKLLLGGHFLLLLALCDYAARIHAGSPAHLLYLETFMSSLSSAVVLLWSAGLGLDYLTFCQIKK